MLCNQRRSELRHFDVLEHTFKKGKHTKSHMFVQLLFSELDSHLGCM